MACLRKLALKIQYLIQSFVLNLIANIIHQHLEKKLPMERRKCTKSNLEIVYHLTSILVKEISSLCCVCEIVQVLVNMKPPTLTHFSSSTLEMVVTWDSEIIYFDFIPTTDRVVKTFEFRRPKTFVFLISCIDYRIFCIKYTIFCHFSHNLYILCIN